MANISFLSDLEMRQRESRLWIDKIGDVMEGHIGNMDVYTVSLDLSHLVHSCHRARSALRISWMS